MTEQDQYQEVYDKVKAHLLTQGEKSMNDGDCMYRGNNGLKCAIGCLIDDTLYNPHIEGIAITGPSGFLIRHLLVKSGINVELPKMQNLLNSLQLLHDETSPKDWKQELESYVAPTYSLNP